MLRPSRPMMRPFISSLGRCMTLTTVSVVCSLATRWTASATMARARSVRLGARVGLDRADEDGGVAAGGGLDGGQQLGLGLLGAEPGDPLELARRARRPARRARPARVELGLRRASVLAASARAAREVAVGLVQLAPAGRPAAAALRSSSAPSARPMPALVGVEPCAVAVQLAARRGRLVALGGAARRSLPRTPARRSARGRELAAASASAGSAARRRLRPRVGLRRRADRCGLGLGRAAQRVELGTAGVRGAASSRGGVGGPARSRLPHGRGAARTRRGGCRRARPAGPERRPTPTAAYRTPIIGGSSGDDVDLEIAQITSAPHWQATTARRETPRPGRTAPTRDGARHGRGWREPFSAR